MFFISIYNTYTTRIQRLIQATVATFFISSKFKIAVVKLKKSTEMQQNEVVEHLFLVQNQSMEFMN